MSSELQNRKYLPSEVPLIKNILYEHIWGIRKHLDPTIEIPFGCTAVSDRETLYGDNDVFTQRLRTYVDAGINKILGLSFEEFIQYSRQQQEQMLQICLEECKKRNKQGKELMDQLEEEIE